MKEYFRRLLFKQAAFAGVTVVAWCFMSNHFHLLIEVPNKEKALEGWDGTTENAQLRGLYSAGLGRDCDVETQQELKSGS